MKDAELNRILTASQAELARVGMLARGHGDTGRTLEAQRPRGSVDQSIKCKGTNRPPACAKVQM